MTSVLLLLKYQRWAEDVVPLVERFSSMHKELGSSLSSQKLVKGCTSVTPKTWKVETEDLKLMVT